MPTPAPRAVRNPRITYDPLEQNHQEPTLTEALLIRSQKQPRARIVGSARYMLDSRKHTREKKLLLRKPRRRENTLNGVHGNDLRLTGPTRLKRCCARARRDQRCRRPPLTSPDCLALSLGHTARSETTGVDGLVGERAPARTPPRRRVLGQATPFRSWESAHRFQGRKCTVLRVTNWQLKSLR